MSIPKSLSRIISLITLAGLLVGCGTASMGPTDTATPTSTPTPAPSPTATVLPLEAFETICLEVEQSYPDVEDEVYQYIAEWVERILTGCGLTVVTEGASCDASLAFDLTLKPLGAAYTGASGRCYTGAEVDGEMVLTIPERATLTLPISWREPTAKGIIGSCPSPAHAPFFETWSKAVLAGMADLWGARIPIQALEERHEVIREAAATTLGDIGPREGVVPALIGALEDESAVVKMAAIDALGKIGPEPGVVSALTQVLEGQNINVNNAVIRALGKMGAGEGVVPALIEVLKDKSAPERVEAALALGEIGPDAMDAVPTLIEALDWWMSDTAAKVLRQIIGQDFGKDATLWKKWWQSKRETE